MNEHLRVTDVALVYDFHVTLNPESFETIYLEHFFFLLKGKAVHGKGSGPEGDGRLFEIDVSCLISGVFHDKIIFNDDVLSVFIELSGICVNV